MLKTDIRPTYSASIVTPFMNTSGKCLRFFYRFLGDADDRIEVFATSEELHHTDILTVRSSWTGTEQSNWLPAIMLLPLGTNIITIRGIRGSGTSGIVLDDIEITDCSSFEGTLIAVGNLKMISISKSSVR